MHSISGAPVRKEQPHASCLGNEEFRSLEKDQTSILGLGRLVRAHVWTEATGCVGGHSRQRTQCGREHGPVQVWGGRAVSRVNSPPEALR